MLSDPSINTGVAYIQESDRLTADSFYGIAELVGPDSPQLE